MEVEIDENNDDMFVVIVGDDGEIDTSQFQPIKIKQEILDETSGILGFEDLFETVEKHGEVIKSYSIKEAPLDASEFTETNDGINENCIPIEKLDSDELYSGNEYSDDRNTDDDRVIKKDKHRFTMLKPWQRKSFVEDLKHKYPELQDDPDLLIGTLSEIMRSVRAPPPPKDFFIINGIMFECVRCGSLSETMAAAQRHYQEKHGFRYLVCYACGVDFRSTTNLYKHEKRCNAPDAVVVLKARAMFVGRKGRSRPFLCNTPCKVVQRKSGAWGRKRKRRTRLGPPGSLPEDSGEVNGAGNNYASTINFKLPMKNINRVPGVTAPNKFGCDMCPAVFASKKALESHEYMHRGQRPFRCHKCPVAYTSSSALTRHVAKHTDIQFICDHCKRSFKVKAALVSHMDTHRPLRKFPCEECGRRYSQRAALRLHIDRAHRNLPPPCACQICPKRYPRMSLLKVHMKHAHGMNLMTRMMFFKSLPTMSETQLSQAKVILKSEVNKTNSDYNSRYILQKSAIDKKKLQESEKSQEVATEIIEEIEENTVLSKDLMEYLQQLQQDNAANEKYVRVIVQNGEIVGHEIVEQIEDQNENALDSCYPVNKILAVEGMGKDSVEVDLEALHTDASFKEPDNRTTDQDKFIYRTVKVEPEDKKHSELHEIDAVVRGPTSEEGLENLLSGLEGGSIKQEKCDKNEQSEIFELLKIVTRQSENNNKA